MKRALLCLLLASALPAGAQEPAPPAAEPSSGPSPAGQALSARDTAHLGPRGSWSVGLFNPLTYTLAEGLEVSTHPLLFLAAPNAGVRVAHLRAGGLQLTGEYGLSVPTPALRLTQGYLFPSWKQSDRRIGWFLIPRAGLAASLGAPREAVLTFSADVAVGLRLGRNDATPLGTLAPLELLLAPALHGHRARVGVRYDVPLGERLRARAYGDAYHHGAHPSPFTFRAGAGVDLAVGQASRLTLGALWWNSDQRARDEATGEPRRSNDVFPTLDFLWAG